MKKLALAAALSLSLSTLAIAGDLGAPKPGPGYKPASVGTAFLTVAAMAFAPTLPGAIAWMIFGSTAAYKIETTK